MTISPTSIELTDDETDKLITRIRSEFPGKCEVSVTLLGIAKLYSLGKEQELVITYYSSRLKPEDAIRVTFKTKQIVLSERLLYNLWELIKNELKQAAETDKARYEQAFTNFLNDTPNTTTTT